MPPSEAVAKLLHKEDCPKWPDDQFQSTAFDERSAAYMLQQRRLLGRHTTGSVQPTNVGTASRAQSQTSARSRDQDAEDQQTDVQDETRTRTQVSQQLADPLVETIEQTPQADGRHQADQRQQSHQPRLTYNNFDRFREYTPAYPQRPKGPSVLHYTFRGYRPIQGTRLLGALRFGDPPDQGDLKPRKSRRASHTEDETSFSHTKDETGFSHTEDETSFSHTENEHTGIFYTIEVTKHAYAWIARHGAGTSTSTANTSQDPAGTVNPTEQASVLGLTSDFERLGGTWNAEKAKEYDKDEAKALFYITNSLLDDDDALADEYETASALWTALKVKYSKTDQLTANNIMTKLQNFTWKDEKDVDYTPLTVDEKIAALRTKELRLNDTAEHANVAFPKYRHPNDHRSSDSSMRDRPRSTSPELGPSTGCLHCKGEHWARDCKYKGEIQEFGRKLREKDERAERRAAKSKRPSRNENKKRSDKPVKPTVKTTSRRKHGYAAKNQDSDSGTDNGSSGTDSETSHESTSDSDPKRKRDTFDDMEDEHRQAKIVKAMLAVLRESRADEDPTTEIPTSTHHHEESAHETIVKAFYTVILLNSL
ncbi:polyprotein [Pyrenophora tritici-repentis]|nr:polyprotein [Pyrenophora tritici-repentis]